MYFQNQHLIDLLNFFIYFLYIINLSHEIEKTYGVISFQFSNLPKFVLMSIQDVILRE